MKKYQGYFTRDGCFRMTDNLNIDLNEDPMVAFVIETVEANDEVEAEHKFLAIMKERF